MTVYFKLYKLYNPSVTWTAWYFRWYAVPFWHPVGCLNALFQVYRLVPSWWVEWGQQLCVCCGLSVALLSLQQKMKIWNWGMFSLHLNTEIAALKKKKEKKTKQNWLSPFVVISQTLSAQHQTHRRPEECVEQCVNYVNGKYLILTVNLGVTFLKVTPN